ncbi:MAG: serine hydrolase, partial [Asticcacaulis sp.]
MWLRRAAAAMRRLKTKHLWLAGAVTALACVPLSALTQTQDDAAAQLHPYVPDKKPAPDRPAEKPPEKPQEKPVDDTVSAPAPVTVPSAGAASSSAAPKPKKPKVPHPAAALGAGVSSSSSSAAIQPHPVAPLAAKPQITATQTTVPQPATPKPAAPQAVTPAKPVAQPAPAPQPPAGPPAAPPTSLNQKPLSPGPAIVQGPQRTLSTPISADDIETFTDSVVRSFMQRDHVVGATVAIVQGDTPLLVKGYGFDRLNPLRRVDPNNSLFRIGSISKVFTWIVARQEIEQGRIRLDAPIAGYL